MPFMALCKLRQWLELLLITYVLLQFFLRDEDTSQAQRSYLEQMVSCRRHDYSDVEL